MSKRNQFNSIDNLPPFELKKGANEVCLYNMHVIQIRKRILNIQFFNAFRAQVAS